MIGEVTGIKNAQIVLNYDGTQAIINMGEQYWEFSPHHGFQQANSIPKGAFKNQYDKYTNKNDLTFLNQNVFRDGHTPGSDLFDYDISVYTCAVASFDDVFDAMITPRSLNLEQSYDIYFDRAAGNGFFYTYNRILYEFEIVDGATTQGKAFAYHVVDYAVSVDNTKLYYLTNNSGVEFSRDGVSTAQLWFKEGNKEPVLIAEDVCYYAYDTDRETFYGMYLAVSPDGSKVAYITDFDLPSKMGTLMMVEDCGQPEIIAKKSTEALRVDNEGNVLMTKHARYENHNTGDWSPFFNYYDLYIISNGEESLLDSDIALAWYT